MAALMLLRWLIAAGLLAAAGPLKAAPPAADVTAAARAGADTDGHAGGKSAKAAPDTRRWTALADTVFRHHRAPEMRYAVAIAQDGDGFLWLGTQNGLVRWDGYRTRIYRADPQDKTALPDNYVLALHADERGRLWVGTAAGGLARYDPATDAFVVLGPGALSNPSVWSIAADGSRGLWLGTGRGLDHLDLATGASSRMARAGGHGVVKAVLQDGDGTLWLGTEHGLLRRAPGAADFVTVPLDVPPDSQVLVSALRRDSAGRLWIGTRPFGAFVIEPGQNGARAVHESGPNSQIEHENISAIVEAQDGEVWLATGGGGVVAVSVDVSMAGGWRTRRVANLPGVATSLSDDSIISLHRDRSGLVWVGAAMAMNLHDPRHRGISTLFGSRIGNQPISEAQVPFVLAAPGDRVWLASGDRGGVEILDPLQGRVAALRPDPDRPETALPKVRVLSMANAPGGAVYLGTRQGLYLADAQGRHVRRVHIAGRPANAAVWALSFDAGVLWMGGLDGLWALDIDRPEAPAVLRHEGAASVGDQRVTAILRGAGSTLWVGTSAGLVRVDTASAAVSRMPTEAGNPKALQAGYVASLLIDAQGRLWVATIGSGVQVLEREDADGRAWFRRLGVREGLPHGVVNTLLLDTQGQVWACTDGGLAVIDPVSFAMRTLGEAQGVAILKYWSNSGARTAAGELLFGGQGGLTVIRPGQPASTGKLPPVVVTEVRAGSQRLAASRFNGPGASSWLDVGSDEHSLVVEFAALDYATPELNRYSYRLQGFDGDWITTDASRRQATYTNLPPGDYKLQIRGAGGQAPWTPAMLELPVRVLPAWYQTLWFRLAAALAALLAVAALVQLRTRWLRRRQHELEALVNTRTAELQLRGEELRASQQQLEQIAYADPLTGLPNRRRFNEELRALLAQALRGGAGVTLLLIDLDHFKAINDTLGHDAGDALLVEMAARLRATLRPADRVARLGGDEFAVLLVDSGEADAAEATCRRIVEQVGQVFHHGGHALQVGASIGMARGPGHASEPGALLKCADLALYAAKAAGRNTWRWHLPAPVPVAAVPVAAATAVTAPAAAADGPPGR